MPAADASLAASLGYSPTTFPASTFTCETPLKLIYKVYSSTAAPISEAWLDYASLQATFQESVGNNTSKMLLPTPRLRASRNGKAKLWVLTKAVEVKPSRFASVAGLCEIVTNSWHYNSV
jgi:hypothetical protein